MTLKINRAPLLSIIKLCASFHHHMWIQTGVMAQERLRWVLTSVTFTFDLWPWHFACTVDSRYLTPVGSQNLRARVKWFSRYLARNISRFRAKATTRDFQGHRPTYMTYSGVYKSQNSMLSDNKVTYVSRISTHIDPTPATNHNKQH